MTDTNKKTDDTLLPLLSIEGIILLPQTQLPLRIYEPAYVAMLTYALAHGRNIGIVQPRIDAENLTMPPLYQVGCVGRLTTYSEVGDNQFLINITGLHRFKITKEKVMPEGFRCAQIDPTGFEQESEALSETNFDRDRLIGTLRLYCEIYGVSADWSVVQNMPAEELISSLAMICPFSPSEKQALLESPTLQHRAETLGTLLEMACLRQDENAPTPRH